VQVAIPDALPTAMLPGPGLLSMTAGDFVPVYGAPGQAGAFDCVATCFFLARPRPNTPCRTRLCTTDKKLPGLTSLLPACAAARRAEQAGAPPTTPLVRCVCLAWACSS